MADPKERDWIDIAAKLMLPLVIAIIGAVYTFGKDSQADKQRQWDRDSGLMRMLVSSNNDERKLGLMMIDVLKGEHKFSNDLISLVEGISKDARPSDPNKKIATSILGATGQSTSDSSKPGANQTREVYIQIAHEEQRARAAELQLSLQKAGFSVPGIDLVAHPTFDTYIRYFDTSGAADANKISTIMSNQHFQPKTQDFAKTDSGGQTALEVWLGDKEPATVAGSS